MALFSPCNRGTIMADSPRDPTMDPDTLYREEIYTDRKVGTLRVMVPVTASGAIDASRSTLYTGEAQLMTNMGPLPISFDIEAKSLAEAVAGYAEAAKAGVEQTMRELAELRRQQSSGLVIPSAATAGALKGGGGLGGLGGGGKLQMP
jgi:hypothetical protein